MTLAGLGMKSKSQQFHGTAGTMLRSKHAWDPSTLEISHLSSKWTLVFSNSIVMNIDAMLCTSHLQPRPPWGQGHSRIQVRCSSFLVVCYYAIGFSGIGEVSMWPSGECNWTLTHEESRFFPNLNSASSHRAIIITLPSSWCDWDTVEKDVKLPNHHHHLSRSMTKLTKDSDQPRHPPSLIRVRCLHKETLGP